MSATTMQYSLQLLNEYVDTLETLPLDLSAHLSELRELDAVLSSNIATITRKLEELADTVEQNGIDARQRLRLLEELTMDVKTLRLGNDDKIKVATDTIDVLASNQTYLSTLLTTISQQMDPSFAPGALFRRTTFPHLPSQPAIVDASVETKRKRAATGRSLLGGGIAPPPIAIEKEREVERESPQKKKRSHHSHRDRDDEDADRHAHKHSHHHHSQSHSHQHGHSINGHSHHSKKHNRGSPSPPLSIGSHPHHQSTHQSHHSSHAHHHSSSHHHRSSHHHHSSSHRKRRERQPEAPTKMRTAGMLDTFLDSHPAQVPYPNAPRSPSSSVPPRSPIGMRGRFELDDGHDDNPIADGELDDDPERKYCICAGPSWGEMLACDDGNCNYQWFHLSCLGFTQAPQDKGKWYCDECLARRNAKRRGEGHRKRGSVAGSFV